MTLRLAAAGHQVTGADPAATMLAAAADRLAARPELSDRVRLVNADFDSLSLDGELFDALCCHGMLMYLDDPGEAVARLAGLVAPGGLLSSLAKNRRAIGVGKALVGDSETARRLIVSGADRSVGNLGRETRGDGADSMRAGHSLWEISAHQVREVSRWSAVAGPDGVRDEGPTNPGAPGAAPVLPLPPEVEAKRKTAAEARR
ncbi:methyltransferase domain-containing protein [Streptomyces scabiei]|uniref:class I SAM-dependent methyltransferase n=1 Tax=Streptomyces scabiei TaxID=1930 RepID=UPI0033EA04C9